MCTPTWRVTIGIHAGTVMSRDIYEKDDFANLDECKDYVLNKFRAPKGYMMGYAYAYGPEKQKVHLYEGPHPR